MAMLRVCSHPGCRVFVAAPLLRCAPHAAAYAVERVAAVDRARKGSPVRGWYGSRRWKARRSAFLAAHPLCAMCAAEGLSVAAVVADHHPPHRGDEAAFWHGPLRALCTPHHDRDAKREQRGGAV